LAVVADDVIVTSTNDAVQCVIIIIIIKLRDVRLTLIHLVLRLMAPEKCQCSYMAKCIWHEILMACRGQFTIGFSK